MYAAIVSLTLMGLVLGYGLAMAARLFKVEGNPVAAEIEALMPGSQCGQCGFPGCAPAAEAVAAGEAPVTLCPPGGKALAEAMADKLGVTVDLDGMEESVPQLAVVLPEACTGCARCFKVCPTDAIIGAPKQLHLVIRDASTGCTKCVESCPSEAIAMRTIRPTLRSWYWPKPSQAPLSPLQGGEA